MIASLDRLGWIALGVMVGLSVGFFPGLSGVTGMAILLPFIFGMDQVSGLSLLIGMAAVTQTGDTFTAVLLGVPGSVSSQATIMDGYPLARQGQAARALGAAFFSSMVGGVIGAIFLLVAIAFARPLVLALGSPELLLLAIVGLSMVALVVRGRADLGLLGALVGLAVGTIGAAPGSAAYRFTGGTLYLQGGIPLAIFALALFAVPEFLDLLRSESVAEGKKLSGSIVQGVRDAIRYKWLVVRNAVLGSFIGLVPGLGGSVVDWIAYGVTVQASKDKSLYGKGDIRGVIGPESANNAKEGGSLIPTLLFGIPGSGTMAIFLGALLLLGFRIGPQAVGRNLPATLTIVWTLVIANILGAGLCLVLANQVSKLTLVKSAILVPVLFVLVVMAAYQASGQWQDLVAFVVIGIIAWFFKTIGIPRPPILIGFVLAGSVERYLHLSISRYGWGWISRPGVLAIMAVAVGSYVLLWYLNSDSRGSKAKVVSGPEGGSQ